MLAVLTEQVEMKEKDNDHIKKSRSKRRAPVIELRGEKMNVRSWKIVC